MHLVSPTDVLPDLPLVAELATTLTYIYRPWRMWKRSKNCSCVTSMHSVLIPVLANAALGIIDLLQWNFSTELILCQNYLKSKFLKSLNKNSQSFFMLLCSIACICARKAFGFHVRRFGSLIVKAKTHQPSKASCELVLPFQSILYCIMRGDAVLITCARLYRVWQDRKSKFAVPGFFYLLCLPLYCD